MPQRRGLSIHPRQATQLAAHARWRACRRRQPAQPAAGIRLRTGAQGMAYRHTRTRSCLQPRTCTRHMHNSASTLAHAHRCRRTRVHTRTRTPHPRCTHAAHDTQPRQACIRANTHARTRMRARRQQGSSRAQTRAPRAHSSFGVHLMPQRLRSHHDKNFISSRLAAPPTRARHPFFFFFFAGPSF